MNINKLAIKLLALVNPNHRQITDQPVEGVLNQSSTQIFLSNSIENPSPRFKLKQYKNPSDIEKSYDHVINQIVKALTPFASDVEVFSNSVPWAVSHARKTLTKNNSKIKLTDTIIHAKQIEFTIKGCQLVNRFIVYPRVTKRQLTGVFLLKIEAHREYWRNKNTRAGLQYIENLSGLSPTEKYANGIIVDIDYTNTFDAYLKVIEIITSGKLVAEAKRQFEESININKEIEKLIRAELGTDEVSIYVSADYKDIKTDIQVYGEKPTEGGRAYHNVSIKVQGLTVEAFKPYLNLFTVFGTAFTQC